MRYGTDIGRIGPMLLVDRYDDRTHFIFELLQNVEDALARRRGRQESPERGSAYWLYVVEHAGDDSARIVRIQDPAGKAGTFTFDHGWLGVADVDSQEQEEEGRQHGEG